MEKTLEQRFGASRLHTLVVSLSFQGALVSEEVFRWLKGRMKGQRPGWNNPGNGAG